MIYKKLKQRGIDSQIRKNDNEFMTTDNQNYILDAKCQRITNPKEVETDYLQWPGVVEVGIFTHCVDTVIVGKKDGVEQLHFGQCR